MKKKEQGFTLIELLVVIAIIGILAAVVLVALGNARDKANEARIKSSISQMSTLANIYYNSNSDDPYTFWDFPGCFSFPSAVTCHGSIEGQVQALRDDIFDAGGASMSSTGAAQTYCVQAFLPTTGLFYSITDGVTTIASSGCS